MTSLSTAQSNHGKTKARAEVSFNPLSPEVIADPYPYYDKLRAVEPVFKAQFGSWLLTRYQDVALVLRDRRFGKSFPRASEAQMSNEPALVAMSRMLLYLNPPDHTRVRGFALHALAMRRIEEMRGSVRAIAESLIARVAANGGMDVVSDYALPLSLQTISNLLGVPEEWRRTFFDNLPPFGRAVDAPYMSRRDLDVANARTRYFEKFFLSLIDLRRRHPSADIVTDMVRAHADGQLSDQELISGVTLLFTAGYETTANLIGNAILALHQHPSELLRVKQDPLAIRAGMDELLRYGASVQFGGRTAMEDVELGGKCIRTGESVIASLTAANRDPTVFPDPHRLDLTRKDVHPMSFGGGIHFCLGAQLGRMEIEVALLTLIERLPDLKLQNLDKLQWKNSFVFRGLQSLAATW